MKITSLTCLPAVAIEQSPIDLGDSRIVHISFEQWLAFEGQSRSAQFDRLQRRYEKDAPAFWEKHLEVDDALIFPRVPEKVSALATLLEPELEAFVKALHWYTGTAPIDPTISVTYFDSTSAENFAAIPELEAINAEGGVQRRYGESEKEYAIQNEHPQIFLRPPDAEALSAMHRFAGETRDVWTQERYDLASQSLDMMSLPGLAWPSKIVLLVGAFEALCLPDLTTNLQKTFESRVAALVADRFDEIATHAQWLRLAYGLRSDVIHGRQLDRTVQKLPVAPNDYVIGLGRAGVVAMCRLLRYRLVQPEAAPVDDPLWALLDSAAQDGAEFDCLHALMDVSPATPITHQWQV
jgi:hypothetical protein